MLQIYTDGAYKSSIDQGGIGIVWMKDDKVFKKYSKGFKHTTNNKMELIAMLCAFKSILLRMFADFEAGTLHRFNKGNKYLG